MYVLEVPHISGLLRNLNEVAASVYSRVDSRYPIL